MKVLDSHGNYGTLVRFKNTEWDNLRQLAESIAGDCDD